MKKIKVNVTKNDIKLGIRYRAQSCPIAIAIRRKFKSRVVATVGTIGFVIKDGVKVFNGTLPARAQDFVLKFDHAEEVKPFSFTATYY